MLQIITFLFALFLYSYMTKIHYLSLCALFIFIDDKDTGIYVVYGE